jgi:hypothetical protein
LTQYRSPLAGVTGKLRIAAALSIAANRLFFTIAMSPIAFEIKLLSI